MRSSELRRHCERRLGALDRERASWFAHWRELGIYILLRRVAFPGPTHRADRGGKRNSKLLDSIAPARSRRRRLPSSMVRLAEQEGVARVEAVRQKTAQQLGTAQARLAAQGSDLEEGALSYRPGKPGPGGPSAGVGRPF